MRFVDYEYTRDYIRNNPNSTKMEAVLDVFQNENIQLNEFQSKYLFLDNRQQGFTTLTIYNMVKYMLLSEHKEFFIPKTKEPPRGLEYDAVLYNIFQNEIIHAIDTYSYISNFFRLLEQSIKNEFNYYLEIVEVKKDFIKIRKTMEP